MSKYRFLGILAISIILVAFFSCNLIKPKKQITIAYTNWAEGIAVTYLAKAIFEEQGYTVTLQNADVAPIFASISNQKADIFMDTWLPVTHADYMEQYGNKLEVIGNIYDSARIGLVVPEYVEIISIEELNKNRQKFSDKIIGIDAGAGIMQATDKAIEKYGLKYKLLTSSGPAMTASLKKAIDRNEWIVVTGWTPHWMFDRFKLRMLEDPENVYGEAEYIKTIAWKGFSKKDPFAAALLANLHLTNEQISSLMSAIDNTINTESEAARLWMHAHWDIVDSWIPGVMTEEEK